MAGKKTDKKREARISNEIVVDAYNAEERALGWYYYLEQQISFPFEAECVKQRAVSPLRKGEKIQITALAPEDDCVQEILVLGRWGGRSLGVPLAQLKPTGADAETAQAIADWHYCVAHDNRF